MPTLNVEAPPATIGLAANTSPQAPATLAASRLRRAALLFLLTLAAIGINGYHPYSDDAGIYIAGIKHAANPALYGTSAAFVTAVSRMSLFSEFNARLLRSLNLSLDSQLFVTQILTTGLLLFACWRLACLCFRRDETRWGAVVLVAVCLSVPIAGSSLFLLDPYVTARSFTMPLTLFGVAACLEGRMLRAGLFLVLVALFHPLMSIYAAGFLLFLWAIRRNFTFGTAALAIATIAAGAAVQFSQRSVIESPAYRAAVATRSYFFLAEWHWYELFGLVAPLALLGIFLFWQRRSSRPHVETSPSQEATPQAFFANEPAAMLARACLATGVTSIAVSLLFVHPASRSHLIAVLQPMRAFVLIYLCLFLLLGGVLAEFLLRRRPLSWAIVFVLTGIAIAFLQHRSYPASPHLELPGITSHNAWTQAFLWIRANTPRDATFALDADYIHAAGEDAQGFRAIAERGSLADASKDGGTAAAFSNLAPRWMSEHIAQTGLNTTDDAERLRRLTPLGASWIVLDRSALTSLPCPFQNDRVKVCQLQ